MNLNDYEDLKRLDKDELINLIFDLRVRCEELEKESLIKTADNKLDNRDKRKNLLQNARDLKREKLEKRIIENREKIKKVIKEAIEKNEKIKIKEVIKKLGITKQTYYNQGLDKFIKKIYKESSLGNVFRFGSIWVINLYKGNRKKEIVVFDIFNQVVDRYNVKTNSEYRKIMKMIEGKYPYVIFEITEKNKWEE